MAQIASVTQNFFRLSVDRVSKLTFIKHNLLIIDKDRFFAREKNSTFGQTGNLFIANNWINDDLIESSDQPFDSDDESIQIDEIPTDDDIDENLNFEEELNDLLDF